MRPDAASLVLGLLGCLRVSSRVGVGSSDASAVAHAREFAGTLAPSPGLALDAAATGLALRCGVLGSGEPDHTWESLGSPSRANLSCPCFLEASCGELGEFGGNALLPNNSAPQSLNSLPMWHTLGACFRRDRPLRGQGPQRGVWGAEAAARQGRGGKRNGRAQPRRRSACSGSPPPAPDVASLGAPPPPRSPSRLGAPPPAACSAAPGPPPPARSCARAGAASPAVAATRPGAAFSVVDCARLEPPPPLQGLARRARGGAPRRVGPCTRTQCSISTSGAPSGLLAWGCPAGVAQWGSA